MGPNDNYDALVNEEKAGFAELYLEKTWNETKLVNEGKVEIYSKLMKIDAELGTKDEIQLLECCRESADLNMIKVNI